MADTVLVTGSCGFLGPFIIEELLGKGYAVRATDLPGADYRFVSDMECEVIECDLLDRDAAARVFRGADMVIHTAARMNYYMDRRSYMLANYQVTVNACEAALAAGVRRFVHFSTCDTYGPPLRSPVDEAHPQRPVNLYAMTKLFGEQAAFRYHRERGLPLSVIRPTTIYGPRCVYVMGLFLAVPVMVREAGVRFLPVPLKGFSGNLGHVEDLAAATVFVMEQERALGEAYNVSDDSTMPAGELLEVILGSVGIRTARVLPVHDSLTALASRLGAHLPRALFEVVTARLQKRWDRVVVEHALVPALSPRFDPGFTAFGRGDYDFDNSKLKSLGYRLRHPDFRTGWRETVRWFSENNWIPYYEMTGRR